PEKPRARAGYLRSGDRFGPFAYIPKGVDFDGKPADAFTRCRYPVPTDRLPFKPWPACGLFPGIRLSGAGFITMSEMDLSTPSRFLGYIQMKILVIGSGGRGHALAWKLAQS